MVRYSKKITVSVLFCYFERGGPYSNARIRLSPNVPSWIWIQTLVTTCNNSTCSESAWRVSFWMKSVSESVVGINVRLWKKYFVSNSDCAQVHMPSDI